jgi:hypothetical protein
MSRVATGLLFTVLAAVSPPEAFALITGGEGNKPITDPGWPGGAAAIFNHPGRIAWWEGPPFGGGQWHAECRGDAKALSAVLADFSRLDVKTRRVVVHDGAGHSFWLAPNREPEKLAAARVDWTFTVWQPASWERLRKLPADLNPTEPDDTGPPVQIDVFTGQIRWADVAIPRGVIVDDRRLEAHGFTAADGVVLEGRVVDLSTQKPIAATVRLERVEAQQNGGYRYPVTAEANADAQGDWAMRKAPAGWARVVVEAGGFVPRVAGYARLDDQPRWYSYDCGLSRPAPVSGRVTDDSGKPLPDAEVRLQDVVSASGGRYESPLGYTARTDAEGLFRLERVPAGKAVIWVHKPGYCRPGLGLEVTTPKDDIALEMMRSASVRVTVDFGGKERPAGYIVQIQPEGGEAVGKFGGSGNIDAANQISYKDVPPGRYVLQGQPNPSSGDQRTEPVTIDLKGGQAVDVTLRAK